MSQQAHRPGTTVPGRSVPALSAALRAAIGEYRAALTAPATVQREAGLRLAEAAEAAIALIEVPAIPAQLTPEFLAQVAQIYREHLDHAPVQAVAKVLGVERWSAGRYVSAARQRGYLPPTSQGKARG